MSDLPVRGVTKSSNHIQTDKSVEEVRDPIRFFQTDKPDENTRSSGTFSAECVSKSSAKRKSSLGTTSFGMRIASMVGESLSDAKELKYMRENHQLQHVSMVRMGEKGIKQRKSVAEKSDPCHQESDSSEFNIFPQRPSKNSMYFEAENGRSVSRIIFQEHEGKHDITHSKHEDFNFCGEPVLLFPEARGDSKLVCRLPRTLSRFHLQSFTREFDTRMQSSVLFSNYKTNAVLAKLDQIVNQYHLKHALQERNRCITQTLDICTTLSAKPKDKGVLKMHESPPGLSCKDNSGEDTPFIQKSTIIKEKELSTDGIFLASSSRDFTSTQAPKLKVDLPSDSLAANRGVKLLGVNMEQTSSSGQSFSIENVELSTATTKGLKVDDFSNFEKSESACSQIQLEKAPCHEPNCRWVKRLKLQADISFALGAKWSKMDDASSSGRSHKLSSRVLNYSRSNNNLIVAKSIMQEPMGMSVKDSPLESLKKSHSWIRRWCHSNYKAGTPRTTSDGHVFSPRTEEVQAVGKAESTNGVLESLEARQFPSIAAMALIGKAVGNLRTCEFRRRGPFVVWNAEEI